MKTVNVCLEGQTCSITVAEIETYLDLSADCISAFHLVASCVWTCFQNLLYPEDCWSSLCSLKPNYLMGNFDSIWQIIIIMKLKERITQKKTHEIDGRSYPGRSKSLDVLVTHTHNEGQKNFMWRLKFKKNGVKTGVDILQ